MLPKVPAPAPPEADRLWLPPESSKFFYNAPNLALPKMFQGFKACCRRSRSLPHRRQTVCGCLPVPPRLRIVSGCSSFSSFSRSNSIFSTFVLSINFAVFGLIRFIPVCHAVSLLGIGSQSESKVNINERSLFCDEGHI